jgi:hypothetical protein
MEVFDMKRALLIVFCLSFLAGAVNAQVPGSIGLFADPAASYCDVYDYAPGIVIVYVVHVMTTGATASQFRVDSNSWGANMLYLSEVVTPPYYAIGNSQTGVSIAYTYCVPSPNMIMYIQYFAQGLSATCSKIKVVDHPTATPPGIYVVDCSDPPNLLTATGGSVVINPDATCMCDIPVEETTWGKIKSLYQ